MKRYLSILVALALLVSASPVFAMTATVSSQGPAGMGTIRTYVVMTPIVDTVGTGSSTLVPVTTIIPGKCAIVGLSVVSLAEQSEGLVSLRDSATVAAAVDTRIINESESSFSQPFHVIFPQPLRITRGVVVNSGANTCVTIYYTQLTP